MISLANQSSETHPLLQQLPLTVSPFLNLPTAPTLPYTYKPMPSTLPPSILAPPSPESQPPSSSSDSQPLPKYVTSPDGRHSAHPSEIISSCRALQSHLSKLQSQGKRELEEFEEAIRKRELAEKRRIAPGWLDSEVRVLQPERVNKGDEKEGGKDEGEELDQVFGRLGFGK